jgi:hypothetical protein
VRAGEARSRTVVNPACNVRSAKPTPFTVQSATSSCASDAWKPGPTCIVTWTSLSMRPEGSAPVFEDAHQGAPSNVRRDVLFERERKTEAVDGGADHQVGVVDDQRAAHIDDQASPFFSNSHRYGPAEPPRRLMH